MNLPSVSGQGEARSHPLSFRDAPLGAGPESMTTNHRWRFQARRSRAQPAPKQEVLLCDQRDSTCPDLAEKINRFAITPNQIDN
jgi:hypothetical protein